MHTKARESMPAVCCAHGNVWNQLINISITSESFEQTIWQHLRLTRPPECYGDISKWGTRTNPAKSTRKWLIYVVFGRKPAVFFRSTLFKNHANIVIWGWWFCQRGSALDRIFWTMLRLGSAEGMGVRLTFWWLKKADFVSLHSEESSWGLYIFWSTWWLPSFFTPSCRNLGTIVLWKLLLVQQGFNLLPKAGIVAAFLSHNHGMLHGCLGLPKPCNSAKIIITMLTTMLVGALYEPPWSAVRVFWQDPS